MAIFFPNAMMDPDWDVLQQIVASRHLFPSLPVLQFIKGHQDANCPYATLSLPAQLNVHADHIAGSYAPRPTETPSIVPMIAGTDISLQPPFGTITTKYRSALHRAAGTASIQHYIQSKHTWTNAEFASINWIVHGPSVRCFYHKKQFIVKLIHEWLPRGQLTSKYKQHHLSTCPLCPHDVEDADHFLRCPARSHWKSDMLQALHNYFDQTPSRPFLRELLITSLSKWLHNEPTEFSNFPPLYNNLIFCQTRIGWKQLFLSCFVLEWSDLQQYHLVLQNITSKKYSGTLWITGVTQIIWHHVYSNWEARNADLHGINATMREQVQYAQAQRGTKEIYSQ